MLGFLAELVDPPLRDMHPEQFVQPIDILCHESQYPGLFVGSISKKKMDLKVLKLLCIYVADSTWATYILYRYTSWKMSNNVFIILFSIFISFRNEFFHGTQLGFIWWNLPTQIWIFASACVHTFRLFRW